MFSTLKKLETRIIKDIKNIENQSDDNPDSDFFYGQISGLTSVLNTISLLKSNEFNALDKWANNEMRKDAEYDIDKR